jgi:hypothetical protein
MELSELQNIWQEYDKEISQNTRLNKEILRLMLISKPERRLNWIKIRAGLSLLSPLVAVILIFVLDVQFVISVRFYIGLAIFATVCAITYFWDFEYFRLIMKVNFSMPVLTLKKEVAQLEKYKIKKTRTRYILGPVAMAGFFMMIIHKLNFSPDFMSLLPVILIILVFFSSMYITFKYSIYERFKKLNKYIDEIEQLEKD